MRIPTEPIGSIPRPAALIAAWADRQAGLLSADHFQHIADDALRDTIRRFEETGSPIVTDGEQTNPTLESPEQVRERVLLAARHLPVSALGTTDDCGFSPFADDASTSREIAFEKIRARAVGTEMAARELGGS